MRRTNTFEVRPCSHRERLLFIELLDAAAACFNEVNYARRQAYFAARSDAQGERTPVSDLEDAVWAAATQEEYRQRYIQTLSSSTPQQLVQKNRAAWTSFFELLRKYRDPDDTDVVDHPSPPGYWKDGDTRRLHIVIRNDQYTLALGERSRLEIPVGLQLKEKYGLGHNERLRLEVRGRPHWEGPNGRLELVYDRPTESFTAHQTVGTEETSPRRRDSSNLSVATAHGEASGAVAAVDIGANTLAAVTTSDGDQLRFHGRPLFERFRQQTREIARLQSQLPPDESVTRRSRAVSRVRYAHRNHAMDALVRRLAEWLAERGVETLFVGALDDVRSAHWRAVVNEKTDLFWAHGRFRRRLRAVVEGEYAIAVRERSEAGTSSECPACAGSDVHRAGDLLQCLACGFEGHADVAASANFLAEQADLEGRPMARPAASGQNSPEDGHHTEVVPCLEWDDHRWRRRDHAAPPKEAPADRSTREGNLATGGTGTA